jgi:hypothetical protein
MISMAPKKFVREAQMIGDGDLPPIQDIPDAHPKKVERFQGSIQKYGSTELSREILKRLSRLLEREEELIFAVRVMKIDYAVVPCVLRDFITCSHLPFFTLVYIDGRCRNGVLAQETI